VIRPGRHAAGGAVGPPPARVGSRELHRRNPGAQKIGVEADDHVGAIEAILRQAARAVLPGLSVEDGRRGNRIIGDVPGIGKSAHEIGQHRGGSGTGDRRRQHADGAAVLTRPLECGENVAIDVGPSRRLAGADRLRQALAVVEPEDRGLADRAGRAAGQRMIRVAFDLDRPSVAGRDQQSAPRFAAAAGGGVGQRPAGHHAFGLPEVGEVLDFGAATARDRQRAE
jgi:hypothetical protein